MVAFSSHFVAISRLAAVLQGDEGRTDEEPNDPFSRLGTSISLELEIVRERTRNIISQSVNPLFFPLSLLSEPGTSYPSFPKYVITRSSTTFSSAVGWWNVWGTVQEADGVERKERKSHAEDMVMGGL